MERSTKYVLTPFPYCQIKYNKFIEFLKYTPYVRSTLPPSYQLDQFYILHSVAFPTATIFAPNPTHADLLRTE